MSCFNIALRELGDKLCPGQETVGESGKIADTRNKVMMCAWAVVHAGALHAHNGAGKQGSMARNGNIRPKPVNRRTA
jgi:hypothetical protein